MVVAATVRICVPNCTRPRASSAEPTTLKMTSWPKHFSWHTSNTWPVRIFAATSAALTTNTWRASGPIARFSAGTARNLVPRDGRKIM
eukprot:3383690-Amphidinium_carterae.1